jgi:hypothetical protein
MKPFALNEIEKDVSINNLHLAKTVKRKLVAIQHKSQLLGIPGVELSKHAFNDAK